MKKRARNVSPEGRKAKTLYDTKRIRVKLGGKLYTYRVPPERKPELMERLQTFRESQSSERREALDGGFHQAVPRA